MKSPQAGRVLARAPVAGQPADPARPIAADAPAGSAAGTAAGTAVPARPLDPFGAPLRLDALDPLASVAGPGRTGYVDDLVRVVREDPSAAGAPGQAVVRTEHFGLYRSGRRILLSHRLSADLLDNDLAGLLADELFTPGWLSGNEIFERVFVGIVSTAATPGPHGTASSTEAGHDPLATWCAFYDNTLAKVRRVWAGRDTGGTSRAGSTDCGYGPIAQMAPVYAEALRLVPAGRVLDLGSCFGFFPLLLSERPGNTVIASDIVPGTVRLLAAVAAAIRRSVTTLTCDAAAVPLPDGAVRTVTLIHLLEHLDVQEGAAVLGEALRLATDRVIVAVPFEDEPAAVYGHVRRFDPAVLAALGAATGMRFTVAEHHGGWLVLSHGAGP